ncbi:MAG TPA: dipeptidase PepE [Candidatus Saccharimonadales bacterium]|nr:dipeptidase PepE [Candidatus Saccharimonadales bacterium]
MALQPNLLLISSSTVHGTGYLDHAEPEIRATLGAARRVIFVPYALADRASYANKAAPRFESMGFECKSIDYYPNPVRALDEADAVFVGGGNTFRLLKTLHEFGLIEAIRHRVAEGMVYMGASAGSNVACPTIRTTNDMPIVEPPTLNALNLFPYQINPHYIDPEPDSVHMGETREERLLQYLEENDTPVIGLREGSMIRMNGERMYLKGMKSARVFKRDCAPRELLPPAELTI